MFRPLRDEAKRARSQMSSDEKTAARASAADVMAIARNRYKEESKLNRDMFKARAQLERDTMKQGLDMAKDARRNRTALELEGIRQVAAAERNAMKIASQERIATMRSEEQKMQQQSRGGGIMGYIGARHVVSGAGRDFSRIMRGAGRFAGQVAQGLGVDFDVGSMVRRNVERSSIATDIVNSAYQPGAKGAASVLQDANVIGAEARGIGAAKRIDPTQALKGMQKFVEVSGDLETSRKIMGELAMLSNATGSNLEHVAEAAGNVAVQFEDSPDKASKVLQIMRAVAGQGKLGAVELRDMAKQMAALAASAGSFSGDKVQTITMMGALAQEARQHGGAKSAPEAAFAVSSFVATLSKKARLAALEGAGVKVYGKGHMINDPQAIITDAIRRTKGDPRILFGSMFSDMRAMKVVRGFSNIYNSTQGTPEQKIAAVTAEFDRLKRSMMGEGEIRDAAARRMDTDEAKAAAFQAKLDETTRILQARLMPTLERMAPEVIKVVEGLGKFVQWAAGNPWEAVSAALALSVAKAGIGEIIARTFAASMGGNGGGALLGGGGLGAGTVAGLGSFALTLGAATLAIGALGLAADQAQKLWNETHVETVYGGDTPEEKARNKAMTPEQRQAEIASAINVAALENKGFVTGRGKEFGPPTASVEEMTNPEKLGNISELQLRILGDIHGIMRSQLTTLEEIRNKSGGAPGGSDGFMPPPPNLGGTTSEFAGGTGAHRGTT